MIYYVEDDENIRELVIYTLNQSGFSAMGLDRGDALFETLKDKNAEKPELVMLDIMLPGEDGMSILKKLRQDSDFKNIPVIMVTAKGAEYDKVLGLDSGADDYIAKPFGMMELVSRVKAMLRRTAPPKDGENMRAGGLVMDTRRYAVFVDGQEAPLTHKEFELLRCLMENRGAVFSREQLLKIVWGYDYDGGTRTVDVHVQTLRQKLGENGSHVETVRGVGYRFGE